MTVLVTLADAAAWVGLAPKVVLAALRLNGTPFIWLNSEANDGSDNEIFLEVDLNFALKVGLPIDMDLLFNQKLERFNNNYEATAASAVAPRTASARSGARGRDCL